jgi:hypothetical protein
VGDRFPSVVHLPSGLTDSDLVYLHGYCFVEKGSWQKGSITLESTGAKVQKEALVNTLLLAALASLVNEGCIEIAIVNTGSLLPCNTPVIRGLLPVPYPKGGLEGALVATLQRQYKLNTIDQVMLRLAGWDRQDPWEEIAGRVREHLAEAGYFRKVGNPAVRGLGKLAHASYKYEANPDLVAGSVVEITRVRSTLAEVQARGPHTWERVAWHMERALRACQAKSDDGHDAG